ncbi:MAG: hypothetical protein ACLQVX_07840 [Limisphaerales bacterium]
MNKRLLNPERLRKIPPHFSWIDHRLVRDNYFLRCDHQAWTLYLFLSSVADAQGLSYYSDASLMRRLKLDGPALSASRQQLVQAGLIAYESPLYQVLGLEPEAVGATRSGPIRVGELLRQVLAGGQP